MSEKPLSHIYSAYLLAVGSAARSQGFWEVLRKNQMQQMSRLRKQMPTYRLHKHSDQAIVTINQKGTRRDRGRHDDSEYHDDGGA